MSTYLPESLKNRIVFADFARCCYCLTTEANSGIPMTYDHILPVSKNGETSYDNLCLACRTCNEFKGDVTEAIDPLLGETTALFNPRTQKWSEHFAWSLDGTRVEGLTAVGRATVARLRMNNPVIIVARGRWVISGWHPPKD
ncbi:HNH endonuclease [Calothrix sp. NIES-2100]|uniref:HNH endonuclease n=1 Tax=Calothrix sp. NIES-2100 TaxID=1954172 RepID=UPI000BBC28E3